MKRGKEIKEMRGEKLKEGRRGKDREERMGRRGEEGASGRRGCSMNADQETVYLCMLK